MEGFSRVSQPSSSAAERRSCKFLNIMPLSSGESRACSGFESVPCVAVLGLVFRHAVDELSDPGSPSDAGSRMEGLLTAPTHSDEEGDEDEQNPAGRPEEGDFAASSAGSSVARGAAAPRLSRGALVPAVLGHRSSTRSIAVRCLCALLETARETSVEVQGRKPPHFEPTVIRKMYTLQPQLTVSLERLPDWRFPFCSFCIPQVHAVMLLTIPFLCVSFLQSMKGDTLRGTCKTLWTLESACRVILISCAPLRRSC